MSTPNFYLRAARVFLEAERRLTFLTPKLMAISYFAAKWFMILKAPLRRERNQATCVAGGS
jgi:hypothetical protein